MTTKLTLHVVTFLLPIGEKNVMKSQNIEVADAKGSHPKNNLNFQKSKQKAVLRLNLNLVEYRLRIVKYCETAILHRHGAIIVIS